MHVIPCSFEVMLSVSDELCKKFLDNKFIFCIFWETLKKSKMQISVIFMIQFPHYEVNINIYKVLEGPQNAQQLINHFNLITENATL